MIKYPWAQNREKLERAIGELGTEALEADIKARYIEMAGLVLGEDGTVVVDAPAVEAEEEEKPKKSKKK